LTEKKGDEKGGRSEIQYLEKKKKNQRDDQKEKKTQKGGEGYQRPLNRQKKGSTPRVQDGRKGKQTGKEKRKRERQLFAKKRDGPSLFGKKKKKKEPSTSKGKGKKRGRGKCQSLSGI